MRAARPERGGPAINLIQAAKAFAGFRSQVFGLDLGTTKLGALPGHEERVRRIRELFREWLDFTEGPVRQQIVDELKWSDMGDWLGVEAPVTGATHSVVFEIRVAVSDSETDEAVSSPRLAELDGCSEEGALDLTELAPLRDLDWLVEGDLVLRYDQARAALRGYLEFRASTRPSDDDIARLRSIIEEELFFSGWGMNLEFDAPVDGWHIHVEPDVVSFSIAEL